MPREIKFRAWEKREKRMISSDEAKNEKSLLAVGFHGLPIAVDSGSFRDDEITGWNIDHRLEIMQYTGLKDNKSKDIYEGDIVAWREVCYQITFAEGSWILKDTETFEEGPVTLFNVCPWAEVIGNIYEHSNLLEEKPGD